MRKFIITIFLLIFSLSINAQKGYEFSADIGGALGIGDLTNSYISTNIINGYRFSEYISTGIGVGFGYSNAIDWLEETKIKKEKRSDALLVPIFANIQVNLPTETLVSPFFSLRTGYSFDINQYIEDSPGFMIQPSLGIDFKLGGKKAAFIMAGINLLNFNYSYTDNKSIVETRSEIFKAIDFRIGFKF